MNLSRSQTDDSLGMLEGFLVVGKNYGLTIQQVLMLPHELWKCLILIWNFRNQSEEEKNRVVTYNEE